MGCAASWLEPGLARLGAVGGPQHLSCQPAAACFSPETLISHRLLRSVPRAGARLWAGVSSGLAAASSSSRPPTPCIPGCSGGTLGTSLTPGDWTTCFDILGPGVLPLPSFQAWLYASLGPPSAPPAFDRQETERLSGWLSLHSRRLGGGLGLGCPAPELVLSAWMPWPPRPRTSPVPALQMGHRGLRRLMQCHFVPCPGSP